jgi:hypothetical protein
MKWYFLLFLFLVWVAGCSSDNDGSTNYVPTGLTVYSRDVIGSGVMLGYGLVEEPVAFNVDSAGPDRRWQFDDYEWSDHFYLGYCPPTDCPFHAEFPSATRAVQFSYESEPDYSYNLFEKVDTHGIWDLGYADADNCDILSPPHCRLELPCTYGTEWAEVVRDSGDYGYQWWRVDSTVWTCDAWGYIVTPFDSCFVLRGGESYIEYYWSQYDTVPQVEYADLNYYWIDQHGDIVAWVSAYESASSPYYDFGYLNLRTSKETISAPATAGASGLERMHQARADRHSSPRHAAKSFSDIRYLR